MLKRLQRLWGLVRHLLSLRSLLDWLGWKQAVGTFMSSLIAVVSAFFLGVSGPILFVIAAVTLMVVVVIWRAISLTSISAADLELFYDDNDPKCYRPGGRVYLPVVSDGNVEYHETLYRLGVKSSTELRGCRVILEKSEPEPHDPSRQRLGLAMRPLIPTMPDSEEFTVNPTGEAYVEILQEVMKQGNPMHEFALIKLTYINELRGRANWFENGDYVLTFRLDGPMKKATRCRIAVEMDGRRQHRRWRVKQLL